MRGAAVADLFAEAFENYWSHGPGFRQTPSAKLSPLGLDGIDGDVAFSPHATSTAMLGKIADDIATATSSVLYSLAFPYHPRRARLAGVLQLLAERGQGQRREPAAVQRPPHRDRLRRRGAAHLRPLRLPGDLGGAEHGRPAAQAPAARAGRGRLVEEVLRR